MDESARKAMFSAAKNVICYLGVFEAAAKDQPATLKACKDHAAYDSSHLNIKYEALPAALPCDKSPVSTFPCEKAWTDANYNTQSWFGKAPTEACTACAPLPGGSGGSPGKDWVKTGDKFFSVPMKTREALKTFPSSIPRDDKRLHTVDAVTVI